MAFLTEVLLGAVVAGAIMLCGWRTDRKRLVLLWAAGLIIAALIYVAFLFRHANLRWAFIECAGLVLFSLVSVAAVRRAPWLLAAGWLAHSGWDVVLHSQPPSFVPVWYPPACAGFDLVVGVCVLVYLRQQQEDERTEHSGLSKSA
ncbi:MAG TPA: hypothetical protein VFI95_24710 [Terriglobales bacterium]|nr:hypothetical protein [Terriglobales bacterium]